MARRYKGFHDCDDSPTYDCSRWLLDRTRGPQPLVELGRELPAVVGVPAAGVRCPPGSHVHVVLVVVVFGVAVAVGEFLRERALGIARRVYESQPLGGFQEVRATRGFDFAEPEKRILKI